MLQQHLLLAVSFKDRVTDAMSYIHMPLQEHVLLWYGIGMAGTFIFGSRTFVQWVYSEKHQESRIPVLYWWLSVVGTVVCLSYALQRRDPVFMMMYTFNMIPYVRNLMLIRKKKREQEAVGFALQSTSLPTS